MYAWFLFWLHNCQKNRSDLWPLPGPVASIPPDRSPGVRGDSQRVRGG